MSEIKPRWCIGIGIGIGIAIGKSLIYIRSSL